MAKTADILQAIWTEPWFLARPPQSKVLYLWAITCTHGNLAGLFVVDESVIRLETKLDERELAAALSDLRGKIHYRQDTGVMWVAGKTKYVRSKSPQIATSIARAVRFCPDREIRSAFLARYGGEAWLAKAFRDAGLETTGEPITVKEPAGMPAGFTDDESRLVDSLLRAFNVEANGIYRADRWADQIVACLRAHPELSEADHLRVVRTAFSKPWWTGAPTPGVIWGNLAQFEKSVTEARSKADAPTYEDKTEVIHA